MQAFLIETEHEQENGELINLPCLVYLPVKKQVENCISLNVRLKPLNQQHEKRRKQAEEEEEKEAEDVEDFHDNRNEGNKLSSNREALMVEEAK